MHLHLEHRVAQRLLSRFTSQGLIHHDLAKACLASSSDALPRVILIGRLSVYGPGASRLHEEIVPVTARWIHTGQRQGKLVPFGTTGEQTTLEALRTALDGAGSIAIPDRVQEQLRASAQADIADLLPHLEARAGGALQQAETLLAKRAESESGSMVELLQNQRARIQNALGDGSRQLPLGFDDNERRQLEADQRAWQRRLETIELELDTEPERIIDSYTIRAHRIDPIGSLYLWPRTG